jgi:multicomponent Na+:H+ antiporter subunit D
MSYGVALAIAFAGNLFTLYAFYECLTMVTLPLVAFNKDRAARKAGQTYVNFSITGAAMAFVGMLFLSHYDTPAGFSPGGVLDMARVAGHEEMLRWVFLLAFIGFGTKAAVFPMYAWLPAVSVAPTPVTALLHAVAVVKSGVFAAIRSTYYTFGPALLAGTWVQQSTAVAAAFTIVFGSVMALREQHLKRRLAYSTVSNLSYILFGMSLMTAEGLVAGLSHMLFHGVIKITLFFCAGTVLCKTGRAYVPQTTGLGRKMPVTFITFLISGLALTGTPLLPGYISKMNLLMSAALAGGPFAMAGIIALLLSAILTAAYLLPMGIRAFLVTPEDSLSFTEHDRDPGWQMLVPFTVLVLTMLVLGIHAEPLMNALESLIMGSV